ncbi:MAG: nicotinate phosphoribosyltransferase [Actinomyces sp.]|nr:MAG: nicotinate phosphoribosyltransferase [Actinomyces sp.]
MVASSLRSGVAHRRATFEVFTRSLPPERAYGVVAGIERMIDAVTAFRFDEATIDHLVRTGVVAPDDETTRRWLADYRFGGTITGYPDGELFFPYSPVVTVEGTFAECVVLETVVLSILNHDSAVASAAARMVDAAGGRFLIEGGARRTDPDAAVAAARAAHIAGFDTTSDLEAGRRHGIPTGGTTAHAFMLAHPSEEEAFAAQRATLGPGSTYLVDTFDTLEGIRRAVEVVGPEIGGVRIDSGDLHALAPRARALLDELGATSCRIVVSGDLDEYRIAELEAAALPVDAYLVGTAVVTGSGHPAAGFVYKLVAVAADADPATPQHAVGKLSPGKRTIGGFKHVHRTRDADGHWDTEVLALVPGEIPERALRPQEVLVADGERARHDTLADARRRCAERRSGLRPEDRTPRPVRAPAVEPRWEGTDEPLTLQELRS